MSESLIQQAKPERNYGIDLLRMLSMFMICLLHTLGQGGVLSHCDQNGVINWSQYYAGWFIEIAAFSCVDLYALISGYVGVDSKFKISRFLSNWLEVAFYTILITVFFSIKYPEMVTDITWKNAIFPIFSSQYWYMTAYFGLLLFMPLLNYGLRNIPKREMALLVILMLIAFTILPFVFDRDLFGLSYGYSMVWLIALYIVGGFFKRYGLLRNINIFIKLAIAILPIIFTYIMFRKGNGNLVNYNSFSVVLSSFGIFSIFESMKIKTGFGKFIIKNMSPLSLAVYLIHVNPLIWTKFIKNFSVTYHMTENPSVILLILKINLAALLIYLICSAIDLIRYYLFKLVHLNDLYKLIDNGIDSLMNKIIK